VKGLLPRKQETPESDSASASAKTIVGRVFDGIDSNSNQGTLLVGLTVEQIRHDGSLLHFDTKSAVRYCELGTTAHKLRKL
jgi:hypothetical protein